MYRCPSNERIKGALRDTIVSTQKYRLAMADMETMLKLTTSEYNLIP